MNYRPFLAEADAYFRVISKSFVRPSKLGNKVTFSICTMMIEKYLVALLLANGKIVTGHTIQSLVSLATKNFEALPNQIKDLVQIDKKMDLCSFSPISSVEPTNDEMMVLFANILILKEYVHNSIEKVNAVSEQ